MSNFQPSFKIEPVLPPETPKQEESKKDKKKKEKEEKEDKKKNEKNKLLENEKRSGSPNRGNVSYCFSL